MSEHIIFGLHPVRSALQAQPEQAKLLWVQAQRDDHRIRTIIELAEKSNIPIRRRSVKELDQLTNHERHQGVVLEMVKALKLLDESDLAAFVTNIEPPALLLVLDGVQDPHNLGACLRSADAAGAHAVVVPKDRAVGLTGVARKSAAGAAEQIPFFQVTNLARALKGLQEAGIWLMGLADEAESGLFDTDMTGSVAIVMGAEGSGLRRLTRENCDHLVSIPMHGSVSSLNVSVATGICLYEVVRQRQPS